MTARMSSELIVKSSQCGSDVAHNIDSITTLTHFHTSLRRGRMGVYVCAVRRLIFHLAARGRTKSRLGDGERRHVNTNVVVVTSDRVDTHTTSALSAKKKAVLHTHRVTTQRMSLRARDAKCRGQQQQRRTRHDTTAMITADLHMCVLYYHYY